MSGEQRYQEVVPYAVPPFHPGYHPGAPGGPPPGPPARPSRRRRPRVRRDPAFWSGLLTAVSVVVLLLMTIAAAVLRVRA